MATAEEVRKLAALSRIVVSDEELPAFTKEFDAIIAYVGQLEKLELPKSTEVKPALRNVMREDGTPHEPGAFTKKITDQFPAKEGDALSVKQIIAHD